MAIWLTQVSQIAIDGVFVDPRGSNWQPLINVGNSYAQAAYLLADISPTRLETRMAQPL